MPAKTQRDRRKPTVLRLYGHDSRSQVGLFGARDNAKIDPPIDHGTFSIEDAIRAVSTAGDIIGHMFSMPVLEENSPQLMFPFMRTSPWEQYTRYH